MTVSVNVEHADKHMDIMLMAHVCGWDEGVNEPRNEFCFGIIKYDRYYFGFITEKSR